MNIVPIVSRIDMRVCFECGYHTKSTSKGLVEGACRNRQKTEKYICRGLGLSFALRVDSVQCVFHGDNYVLTQTAPRKCSKKVKKVTFWGGYCRFLCNACKLGDRNYIIRCALWFYIWYIFHVAWFGIPAEKSLLAQTAPRKKRQKAW